MQEVWKDIPGYEGLYQVSNIGRVKSLPKQVRRRCIIITKEKILSNILSGGDYYHVALFKGDTKKYFRVNILVAMAFLDHKPNGRAIVVDHINNVKTDNRLENLQVITHRLNCSKDTKSKTSKYTGVRYKGGKYETQISINNKMVYLGRYDCELKAHLVYQNKIKEIENGRE